jgi:hypothetical protein
MKRITLARRPLLPHPRLALLILVFLRLLLLPAADTVFRYQGSLRAKGSRPKVSSISASRCIPRSRAKANSARVSWRSRRPSPMACSRSTSISVPGFSTATPAGSKSRSGQWHRTNDFVPLAPRQPVRPTPYAIHAFTATATTAATAGQRRPDALAEPHECARRFSRRCRQ